MVPIVRAGAASDAVGLQKYEIWLQSVRQEVTIAEAAAQHRVDRSTVMRIRTVAKEGALAALAASKPGVKGREHDYELEQAKAECPARTSRFGKVDGRRGRGT